MFKSRILNPACTDNRLFSKHWDLVKDTSHLFYWQFYCHNKMDFRKDLTFLGFIKVSQELSGILASSFNVIWTNQVHISTAHHLRANTRSTHRHHLWRTQQSINHKDWLIHHLFELQAVKGQATFIPVCSTVSIDNTEGSDCHLSEVQLIWNGKEREVGSQENHRSVTQSHRVSTSWHTP